MKALIEQYRPRRAAAKYLVNAPEYVLACYDNGGRTADRYTVVFGGSMWSPNHVNLLRQYRMDPRLLHGVSMSENPTHPQGVSMWGYVRCGKHLGRLVAWSALPNAIREHVQARVTEAV